ncbi:MAG TPA: cation diffusion facilitator family transporter [Gemmatimonadales bacterium]|nr:cation diffusion facilitator family transporter [Gemmatimonadales bacterium]
MPRPDPAVEERTRLVRRVLLGVLLANLAVVVVKFLVGFGIGSLAVVGDAVHSSVDAINNLFGLAVVRFASKGPDAEHPYGHAKFESLGALLIVVFLSLSVFELLRGAWDRLVGGAPALVISSLQVILLLFTLLINLWVVWYETRAGRRLKSPILLADASHTRVDVFITIAVLGGLYLTHLGYPIADPILAIVVAFLVVRVGWEIVGHSLPTLVDGAAVDEPSIRTAAEEVPGVRSAYAIRSRTAAALSFAEVTIAVDGAQNVTAAHAIADAVEDKLRDELGFNHVQVHVEPC